MQERTALTGVIRFGVFTLDAQSGELRKGPARLRVPDQSIEILKALLERPGEIVTRDELRQRLWSSDTFVDFDAGLNAAVKRLRDALGDSAEASRLIETLPRRGYRFIGAVHGSEDPAFVEVAEPSAVSGARRRIVSRGTVIVIAALMLMSGAALWMVLRSPTRSIPQFRLLPVTTLPGLELDPAISPDGNQVAYAWDNDGKDFNVYVKVIGEEGAQQITTDPAEDRSPAWSPDGRLIAFLRTTPDGGRVVVVVSARGGGERVLQETQTTPDDSPRYFDSVSWTSDGNAVLFADRAPGSAGASAIFACSVETRARTQLTFPRGFTDAQPAISPDGRYLGFVRRVAAAWVGYLFVQRMEGLKPIGEAQRVTADPQTAALGWADSRTIVYDRYWPERGLWRIRIGGGSPEPVFFAAGVVRASVALSGTRIVFSRSVDDTNIWKLAGPAARQEASDAARPVRLIDSTSNDGQAQISHDGTRIAFISGRSGSDEIWTAPTDGSAPPFQVTRNARAGSPRWSADGQTIAFDAIDGGSYHIYTVSAQGGAPRALTNGPSNDVRPSWSADGRTIYFGSNRAGEWQIWKMDADGKNLARITQQGGGEPFASVDGRFIYYAKFGDVHGIWRVRANGGEEIQIIDRGVAGFFSVTSRGIVLMDTHAAGGATIEFFDTTTGKLRPLHRLPPGLRFPRGATFMAASADGQSIAYSQYDRWGSDIQMLERVK